jgi:hypothetical protein
VAAKKKFKKSLDKKIRIFSAGKGIRDKGNKKN